MFRFTPQTVQPQRGAAFPVNSFSFDLYGDSLVSYLPYFGEAQMPQINPSRGPLDFTTGNFSYSSKPGKKGNSRITIVMNDPLLDAQEFFLTVSSGGFTNMRVRFSGRQAISFNGEITALPAKR